MGCYLLVVVVVSGVCSAAVVMVFSVKFVVVEQKERERKNK